MGRLQRSNSFDSLNPANTSAAISIDQLRESLNKIKFQQEQQEQNGDEKSVKDQSAEDQSTKDQSKDQSDIVQSSVPSSDQPEVNPPSNPNQLEADSSDIHEPEASVTNGVKNDDQLLIVDQSEVNANDVKPSDDDQASDSNADSHTGKSDQPEALDSSPVKQPSGADQFEVTSSNQISPPGVDQPVGSSASNQMDVDVDSSGAPINGQSEVLNGVSQNSQADSSSGAEENEEHHEEHHKVSDAAREDEPLDVDPSEVSDSNQVDDTSSVELVNHQTAEQQTTSQTMESKSTASPAPANPIQTNGNTTDLHKEKEFRDLQIPSGLRKRLTRFDIIRQTELQQQLLPYLLSPGKSDTPSVFLRSRPWSGTKTGCIIAALANINPNVSTNQIVFVCPTFELAKKSAILARKLRGETRIDIKYIMHDDRPVDGQIIFSTINTLACFNLLGTAELKQVYLDEMDELFATENKRLDHFLTSLRANCQLIGSARTFANHTLTKFSQFGKNLKCLELMEKENYFDTLLQFRVTAAGDEAKIRVLIPMIQSNPHPRTLVFVADASSCKAVYHMLQVRKVNAFPFASDMKFEQRELSLETFLRETVRRKTKSVLIVQDRLLAGYQMKVSLVVNWDLKLSDPNEYLYRVAPLLTSKEPGFVVNLLDDTAWLVVDQMESYFGFKLISLNV